MSASRVVRRVVRGVNVPTFLYGTAWKEERTASLVLAALAAGFRGIDTANQRKHYDEASVGRALASAFAENLVTRDELFLQTKFTFVRGQDHRLPYDPAAPIAQQVEQSFRSSLEHLGVSAIDALVLHGPTNARGLVQSDRDAWQAMERLCDAGGTKLIGISNVAADQLALLVEEARIAPAFVQNRCYASRGWDAAVRAICDKHGIVYQGFSLLTANRNVTEHETVAAIAKRAGATAEQVIFRFALSLGMLPLTGTTSADHMRLDLTADRVGLTAEELRVVGALR